MTVYRLLPGVRVPLPAFTRLHISISGPVDATWAANPGGMKVMQPAQCRCECSVTMCRVADIDGAWYAVATRGCKQCPTLIFILAKPGSAQLAAAYTSSCAGPHLAHHHQDRSAAEHACSLQLLQSGLVFSLPCRCHGAWVNVDWCTLPASCRAKTDWSAHLHGWC